MAKILVIHPYDKTTLFLKDIYEPLVEETGNITVFNVATNYASHSHALTEISKEAFETIIFMGHGRSYSLFGARGNDYDEELEITEEMMIQNPLLFYEEKFIKLLYSKKS